MNSIPFFNPNTQTFYLYNKYHLGDNVFNIIFFNKITPYLKKRGLKIEYFMEEGYIGQVSEFVKDVDVIQLKRLNERENKNALEAWINNREIILNHELQIKIGFDTYYIYFFNQICGKMGIHYSIMDLKYIDNDLRDRYNLLKNKYIEYGDLDILIINSEPLSGQFRYNKTEWNRFINYLNRKYRIVTTLKVHNTGSNIPCTMDNNLSIKDIASLSTKVRYIISINTGPFVGCYNVDTLQNVEKIFMFVNNLYYDHPKIETYKEIEDLYLYL